MDVVDARTDLVRVVELLEGLQQLHVRTRSLDGDHVGVHGGDGLDHIVELAVAHVRMDLGFVADSGGAQAEGLGGPLQIVRPGVAAQRQAFAESRLVDLHDPDAGGLQVDHFVADRQGQLARLHLARHVLAREGPHQHGHRAGQHALHHLVGKALGVPDPLHGHGPRTAQVAIDHRRLHAARAVALHPAEAGEDVAVQLLGEVLDHVVALGLAVHQHVQPQLLLDLHRMADLAVHRLDVLGLAQLALLERLAGQADRRGLREGADGGGRERRQVESGALPGDAFGERRAALGVAGLDRGQARLHGRLVDSRRRSAAGLDRTALFQGGKHLGGVRLSGGTGQHRDFAALLHGEGQPALQLGVQPVFALQVHRAVQQRAGRRDPQPLAQALPGMAHHFQGFLQVAAPDVASVDQAQRDDLVGRQAVEDARILFRRSHQVDVQAVHREVGGQAQVVFQAAEVGGDQLLQRFAL
ncbi:Uncharacterised protein [Pseudomonas aeruginosa]|nr:Uncharacterised protein [Pseudomonas aeruginosa]